MKKRKKDQQVAELQNYNLKGNAPSAFCIEIKLKLKKKKKKCFNHSKIILSGTVMLIYSLVYGAWP